MSEDYGADFFSVTDEDGNEFELELLDTLDVEDTTYYAFVPATHAGEDGQPVDLDADDEEVGIVIMKLVEQDGEEILSTPDSDEEAEKVFQLFMEQIFNEDEE